MQFLLHKLEGLRSKTKNYVHSFEAFVHAQSPPLLRYEYVLLQESIKSVKTCLRQASTLIQYAQLTI